MTEDLFVRKLNLPLEQDSLCAFLTRHTLYWKMILRQPSVSLIWMKHSGAVAAPQEVF